MSSYFPTEFAMKMAKINDLFPEKEISSYNEHSKNKKKKKQARKAHEQWERLEDFQNLSISGSFKEAMIAYNGYELEKPQKKALKKIHLSTGTWAKGRLVDKVLSKLADTVSGKEVKELSDIMIRVLGMEDSGGGSGITTEPLVIVRSANVKKK